MKSSDSPIPRQHASAHHPSSVDLENQIRDWMLAAIAGDKEAYKSFLNRVAALVNAYLMKSMNPQKRSAEKIEELTQDVLMSIHQKRATYRPEMPIMPWLFAIARYRLIDSIRSEARRPQTVAWTDECNDIPGLPAGTAEHLSEGAADVEALLEGLSDRQRQVLVLAKLEDVPLADVARKLDMSLSSVKVTIHRAIRLIRRKQEGGAR